jgi:type I restriction enzyme S subunit
MKGNPEPMVSDLLQKIKVKPKILSSEYEAIGKIPVIDQGAGLIGGYTSREESCYRENLPIILFGDHTRRIKYIDFPFAQGADGTQLIIPKNESNINRRFFYYALQNIDLSNYAYARHFKFLKDSKINIPKIEIQNYISHQLSSVEDVFSNNQNEIIALENTADNIFIQWFVKENEQNELVLNSIIDEVPKSTKLKTNEYSSEGAIPIIDQSKNFIAGYTDNPDSLIEYKATPFIVFGDHTRCLKLINFDFARGADGTQIILSKNTDVNQYYLYHFLKLIDLSNYNYARHYKFLKAEAIAIPDRNKSIKFSEIATCIYDNIRNLRFQNFLLNKILVAYRNILFNEIIN